MQASSKFRPNTDAEVPLQFLLFVDPRPSCREQIRRVRSLLAELGADYPYEIRVVDVTQQPYLAEHFRLVTTPALMKVAPLPRQILAGSDLIHQLRSWWLRWQNPSEQQHDLVLPPEALTAVPETLKEISSIAQASEFLQLSDQIFQLNQAVEELKAQLSFKDQIILMLAHDLRNPLTAASIALETLDVGLHPTEERPYGLTPSLTTQLLRQARSQLRTIDQLITDILQASHGSNAELHIQPQEINLGVLFQDVLEMLQEQLATKMLNLETDIPSDLPLVYADPDRIRQVLMNLLDNAIKYTCQGGSIRISILHRTTQKVQASICDNGPGIPEDKQDQIFEDRFRLKRDQDQTGYGIGLSLCRRIIRAHYGQIWVDSPTGQGSCFHFTLPVYQH
jgi:two-component system clock-associated histidine kinase SasA